LKSQRITIIPDYEETTKQNYQLSSRKQVDLSSFSLDKGLNCHMEIEETTLHWNVFYIENYIKYSYT